MAINELKENLIKEIEQRCADKIIEPTNAELLIKLINNADSATEAMAIAELGTTYKRTGFHFDKRLEKMGTDIKYLKKNEKLSFINDKDKLTHKLIIGDNYDALLNLMITHKGKIDVIYIDPPYGKDSMGEFADTNYTNSLTRDNLLSMLYPRLLLARELLSEDGVIFVSIDDKNQAYLKCLMDDIFNECGFVANFVWKKTANPNSTTNNIGLMHEYIITYSKNKDFVCVPSELTDEDKKKYTHNDEHLSERGPYKLVGLNKTGTITDLRINLQYDIIAPDGTIIKPKPRWRWSKEKLEQGIKENRIVFSKTKDGWSVSYKQYLLEDTNGNTIQRGKLISTLLLENCGTTTIGTNELNSLLPKGAFDFPKPVELIKHLLKIINKNAIVLDFFAGSGTTGQAVMELNKEDNGNRQFILCTNNEITSINPNGIAYDVTAKRLKRIMSGECYNGSKNFEWIEKNTPYGDNLNVFDIESVNNSEHAAGKSPFDVIDETCYEMERFQNIEEKIQWICQNFENTQKYLE